MLKMPEKLVGYVDFEEGKLIKKDLPSELEADFEAFQKVYKKAKEEVLSDI